MTVIDGVRLSHDREPPWLQPETPIGVPAFTPFRVRTTTENCRFQLDAWILRMVYIGGLSQGDDPTAHAWSFQATQSEGWSGIEFPTPWSRAAEVQIRLVGPGPGTPAAFTHRDELSVIERTTGFSRRQLTDWLHTSHTTLNGIANEARKPRTTLARRISDFYRLVRRLAELYDNDAAKIQYALVTPGADGRSAVDYVMADDYTSAASTAQFVFRTPRQFKPPKGRPDPEAATVAVEDI